jgi:hypothetical protein
MHLNATDKVVLAKLHTAYQTDPVPTAGADAIQTKNFSINPLEGNRVNRQLDRSGFSNNPNINVGAYVSLSFSVELTGPVTAGTAPGFGGLLTACANEETTTVTTGPSEYAPENLSSEIDAVAIYYNNACSLHKVLGCRGSWSLAMSAENIPMITFNFIGIYARPEALAQYAADFSQFRDDPLPMNKVNTPVTTIDGYACALENFQFDVKYRNIAGFEEVIITNRLPTWSATIQDPGIGAKNFYALAESQNGIIELPIVMTHGPASNQGSLSLPQVQLDTITEGESDGIKMLNLGGPVLTTDAGGDDFLLTIAGGA